MLMVIVLGSAYYSRCSIKQRRSVLTVAFTHLALDHIPVDELDRRWQDAHQRCAFDGLEALAAAAHGFMSARELQHLAAARFDLEHLALARDERAAQTLIAFIE